MFNRGSIEIFHRCRRRRRRRRRQPEVGLKTQISMSDLQA